MNVPESMRSSLIRSFTQHCRPWMPIVSEDHIRKLSQERPNSLLMTAILVAGSRVSASPRASAIGAECYTKAKWVFFSEQEADMVQVIMALIFLQWWNPSGPEHVSLNNSSFWLRVSVALAHQIGLHKEPGPHLPDAHLRRVLWWTLVVRLAVVLR